MMRSWLVILIGLFIAQKAVCKAEVILPKLQSGQSPAEENLDSFDKLFQNTTAESLPGSKSEMPGHPPSGKNPQPSSQSPGGTKDPMGYSTVPPPEGGAPNTGNQQLPRFN